MGLKELLALAKDYRGEESQCKNPFERGDVMCPRIFAKTYKPLDILIRRLRHAVSTSFELDGEVINNTVCDGTALICDSHTFCDGGSSTWSNKLPDPIGYTRYFMSDCVIIKPHDWPEIDKDFYFVINPKLVAIHHKVLSDGRFELEILDPRWIIGYFRS